eukprot:4657074-Prymnesium_polylepis.1
MKEKQAKTEALLQRMRMKTPQQGKVRVILPFQLLRDDTTQGDKLRARIVDSLFCARNKSVAMLANVSVIQMPIADAVRRACPEGRRSGGFAPAGRAKHAQAGPVPDLGPPRLRHPAGRGRVVRARG